MNRHPGPWLRNNLERHWKSYRKRLRQCQHRASEDAVHKLRTTTRRLLALIELLQQLAPHPSLKRLRKTFKAQLDELDHLRDTQVMRQTISDLINEQPNLSDFLHHLYIEEQRLLIVTDVALNRFDQAKLRRPLQKAVDRCQRALAHQHIDQRLMTVIDTLYQSAMERHRHSDATQPATLHALRISIKKLRYSLELAQAVLPPLPDSLLPKIQDYLNKLGDIQNARVLQHALKTFYDADFPEALCHFLDPHTLINDYLMTHDAFHDFWRADSQQSFPWETE